MSDWTTTTVRHGTPSGYRLHQKLGERPCDPCYQARQAADARRKSATRENLASRLSAQAQGRAYRELAHRYPDEYRELYLRFKAEFAVDAIRALPKAVDG